MKNMIAEGMQTQENKTGHIRPFDVRSDLLAVSDLVEICFADRLSRDGEALLKKMRASARSRRFQKWAYQVAGRVSMPFTGYVWVEDGEVVGNLSLIPYHLSRHDYYMIANVAVHPDYQRRGIGRALVRRAMEFLSRHDLDGIWLQVNEDNQGAIQLYQQEGFREQLRRTTWYLKPDASVEHQPYPYSASTLDVERRSLGGWNKHRQWLQQTYPPEVRWHLPLKLRYLRGGILGFFTRLLYVEPEIKQWSAFSNGELVGVMSWQSSKRHSDWLWLAAPQGGEDRVLDALIPTLSRSGAFQRRVRLDYPAGRAESSLTSHGFIASRTLIWMKHNGLDPA